MSFDGELDRRKINFRLTDWEPVIRHKVQWPWVSTTVWTLLLTIVRNELSSFSKAPRILEFERESLVLFQYFHRHFQKP